MANDSAKEDNIASCACCNIKIGQGRSARIVRINMDYLSTALFGLHHVGERNWMSFSHIAAHDQNAIAINKILRKSRGAAATERSTQTGYSRAVSYTGLVLDRHNA